MLSCSRMAEHGLNIHSMSRRPSISGRAAGFDSRRCSSRSVYAIAQEWTADLSDASAFAWTQNSTLKTLIMAHLLLLVVILMLDEQTICKLGKDGT